MKTRTKFILLLSLFFSWSIEAQESGQLDEVILQYQKELQGLASDFRSESFDDNPTSSALSSRPEALKVLIGKGEALWQKYLLKQDLNVLIQSFKAFKRATKVIEEIVDNKPSSKARSIVGEMNIDVYEGALRSALEGYNISGNAKMMSEALTFIEQHHALDNFLTSKEMIASSDQNGIFSGLAELRECQEYLSKSNQGLVEYFVGAKTIYALIVWPRGVHQLQVIDRMKVLNSVQTMQGSMRKLPVENELSQNYSDFTTASFLLFQTIFNHPVNVLPKELHSIVVIPHRQLNAVPFDLLLTEASTSSIPSFSPNDLEYIIEKYKIKYEPSVTSMMQNDVIENFEEQDEALHKTKLNTLSDTSKNHPYYWKSLLPFDGKAIEKATKGNNRNVGFILLAALLLAGVIFGVRRFSKPS